MSAHSFGKFRKQSRRFISTYIYVSETWQLFGKLRCVNCQHYLQLNQILSCCWTSAIAWAEKLCLYCPIANSIKVETERSNFFLKGIIQLFFSKRNSRNSALGYLIVWQCTVTWTAQLPIASSLKFRLTHTLLFPYLARCIIF